MADRSVVAQAYAEVRADLSKLPGDLAAVPSLLKRMVSTQGLAAIRDILTGNLTSGLVSLATQGYTVQAEKLRALADQAQKTAKQLAAVGDVTGAKQAAGRAEKFRGQAATVDAMGQQIGGKVALASRVGIAAIGAIAAAATAYFATTVAAAHAATANLKTAQLVRATGEAAGWSAEQLRHMGDEVRKNSNFSTADIAGAQQALLRHPNVKGDQFDKGLKTAVNIAAVMGETLPQAASELGVILAGLNDPLAVNGEMLTKYGVLLNGAQQGAIRNAIATRDWAKAQDLVLGHLSGFSGAAKEASETGVGGFAKLKSSALAAAVTIGGLNGDIGKLAARAADAIDAFMGLQGVKDVLDLSTAQWRLLTGIVSEFIDSNRADIEKWAGQVSEIYHNVRDQILEAWDFIKKVTQEALASILGSFGVSWTEIKAVVTAVLDEISLLTTNFGLTAKYVWLAVQYDAQQTWDKIRDGLALVAVAFEATWASVAKGAHAAWAQIQEAFGGPAAASIADEMAKGFKEGLEAGAIKYKFGDSDAAKELKRQLAEVRKQMEDARDIVRGKRDTEAKRLADRDKALETPGKGGPYVNTKPFKFEFTGFEELAKKVQTSLYPTEQIQLARAGVAAAEATANNGMEANKKLDKIVDGLKGGMGFAP